MHKKSSKELENAWWELLLEKPTESAKTPRSSAKSPMEAVSNWWNAQLGSDEHGKQAEYDIGAEKPESKVFTAETQKLLCRLDSCNAGETVQSPVFKKLSESLDEQMKRFNSSFFGVKQSKSAEKEAVDKADVYDEEGDEYYSSESDDDSSSDNSSISTEQQSAIFSAIQQNPYGNENGLLIPSKYKSMLRKEKRKKLRRKKHIVGAEIAVPSSSSLSEINQTLLMAQNQAQTNIDHNRIQMTDDMSDTALLLGQLSKKSDVSLVSKTNTMLSKGYRIDNEFSRKSCILTPTPKVGILKKLGLSQSSSGTASTLKNSTFDNSVLQQPSSDEVSKIYEPESNIHAYLAYYQRGPSATQCIRLYEHQRPKRFPTLSYEVVVQIEASTVTPTDCAVRRGEWWANGDKHHLSLPLVPGTAFVGRVIQADGKSGFVPGEQVCSLVRVGANARHIAIKKQRLVKVPGGVSNIDGVACLPEIYLSAFQALQQGRVIGGNRYRKNSLANMSVLILNVSTALTAAIIELGQLLGASSVYATADEKSFDSIEKLGAVALHKEPYHWFSLLKGRIDLVIMESLSPTDAAVGVEYTQILQKRGRLVIMSAPGLQDPTIIQQTDMLNKSKGFNKRVVNYNVFDSWEQDPKQAKRDLSHLIKHVGYGRISPRIMHRVPLNAVSKMHSLLETKSIPGVIICRPWRELTMDSLADHLSYSGDSKATGNAGHSLLEV